MFLLFHFLKANILQLLVHFIFSPCSLLFFYSQRKLHTHGDTPGRRSGGLLPAWKEDSFQAFKPVCEYTQLSLYSRGFCFTFIFLSRWNQLLSRNALWGNRGKTHWAHTLAACTDLWTLSFSSSLFIFKANRTRWGFAFCTGGGQNGCRLNEAACKISSHNRCCASS